MSSYSQSLQEIKRFLDFSLEQPISEVRSIVDSKYGSSSKWQNDVCTIINVRLADENFDRLTLKFNNGKLTSAHFLNSPNSVSTLYHDDYVRGMESQARLQQQLMGRLYSQFVTKYGKETASTNTSIIWKDLHGNSITLFYTINDDPEYNTGNVNVVVKYSIKQDDF